MKEFAGRRMRRADDFEPREAAWPCADVRVLVDEDAGVAMRLFKDGGVGVDEVTD